MASRLRALFTREFGRIWWVSFSAATAGFFLFPTAPFRLRELGAPPEAAGWFLGGLTYGSAAAAAWTGALGDVLGRRRVLSTAGVTLAGLAAVYAVVPDWRVLVALSIPHGVVWSGLLTSANSELVHVLPPERRAEGIAWFGVATILAIAVAPAVGIWILERDWRLLCGLIFALDLGVALLAMRLDRDPPVPADWRARLAPRRAVDWRTLALAGALLAASFGYGGLTSFAALYAESLGVVPKGVFFIAFAVTILVVRPLVAPLVDRRGARRALPASFLAIAAGLVAVSLAATRFGLVAAAALFGLGFSVLGPAFTSWTVERVDAGRRGAAMGALLAAFDLGIGTGSIVLGPLVERWGYPTAFRSAALLALAAWPYLLLAELRLARRPSPFRSVDR
ncbi:MAG TPA: MFS transporter [Thermoanaerobaculia bacterium]